MVKPQTGKNTDTSGRSLNVSTKTTLRNAATRGVRDACGLPALVLLASYIGFGSLARESGLHPVMALSATAGVWGLPGQIALAELYTAGTGMLTIAIAVSFANARFLPMAVSFMPLLQGGVHRKGWLYLLVHLLSVNSWVAGLRVFSEMNGNSRVCYFVVFAGICVSAALLGTGLGFFAAGSLPRPVTLGLIFLNPVFFALVFAGVKARPVILALILGAVLGPVFHLVSADWAVLSTGLIAGTMAYWLTRRKHVKSTSS